MATRVDIPDALRLKAPGARNWQTGRDQERRYSGAKLAVILQHRMLATAQSSADLLRPQSNAW